MKMTPHVSLAFDGRCEAAFKFYERSLNGTIAGIFTWGNSPTATEAPPGWEAKVMHATIRIGDAVLAGGDPPPHQYERPQGFSLLLETDDPVEAKRVFEALSENARIEMPLQQTFWARQFGSLVDQFGIPWSINCE